MLCLLLVAGCTSEIRIGYIGSTQLHKMSARYVTYAGSNSKNINLSTGDGVQISYDIELKKGSISLSLTAPDGEVMWEESIDGHNSDEVTFTASQTGNHKLLLRATDAGGRHEVSWIVQR